MLHILSDIVQGKSVLELGSGAGLVGIVVATLQIRSQLGGSLCLTDGRSDVVRRCEQNVALACSAFCPFPQYFLQGLSLVDASSCHSHLTCCQLDWQDALDTSSTFSEDIGLIPDLVIGADIVTVQI